MSKRINRMVTAGALTDILQVTAHAGRRRRTRRLALGAAGVAAAACATVSGVALTGLHSDNQTTTTVDSRPAVSNHQPKPAMTIKLDGPRYAPYGLPTLVQFAASGLVHRTVAGTVTSTQAYVADDDSNTVMTLMTVKTTDPLGILPSQTITVREVGGVVPLRDVRADVEPHTGPIPTDQLDNLVDFTDGTAHPVVGETELFFLKALPASENATYSSLARMTLDPSTKLFRWAGEAPNPDWTDGLTLNQVASTFASLLRVS